MSERADLDELARRYLDLWQDQMTALAGDKEFAETMQRLMTTMGLAATAAPEFWRAWPATMAGLQGAEQTQGASDDQSREAGPGAPARSAPGPARGSAAGTAAGTAAPAAASDGGESGLDQFARRLAALEERIAALEAAGPKRRGGAASKPRKGRS
jgi:uncharacterized protein YhaN